MYACMHTSVHRSITIVSQAACDDEGTSQKVWGAVVSRQSSWLKGSRREGIGIIIIARDSRNRMRLRRKGEQPRNKVTEDYIVIAD